MTPKEFAKKIIASINPGTADISGIGDGTIKGAISEQNKNLKETVVVTGNFASTTGFSGLIDYPEGFTVSNCFAMSFEVYNSGWRSGTGVIWDSERVFVTLEESGIRAYNNVESGYGMQFRVILCKL